MVDGQSNTCQQLTTINHQPSRKDEYKVALIQERLFARAQLNSVVEGILAPQPRDFSLIGARFMGKTSILTYLASPEGPLLNVESRKLNLKETPVVHYYDCAWPEAKSDLLAFLVDPLCEQIRQQGLDHGIDLEQIHQERDAGDRLHRLVAELKQSGYRPVLLLDNFDSLIVNAGAEMERKIDQLRPLTREIALVVASERPLHETNRELASSPLFNLLNQVFLRLIEPEETENLLRIATAACTDQEVVVRRLAEWTGGHPFLLSRIEEILLDVDEMLPAEQPIGEAHLPLIRLRLTQDYGQLLFGELWSNLQDLDGNHSAAAFKLVRDLLDAPLALARLQPKDARPFYWLLNNGIVRIDRDTCHLFSSLFEEYVSAQLEVITRHQSEIAEDAHTLVEKESQQFTPQERNLLRYFMDRPGEIISIEQLLAEVWKRPTGSTRRVQEGIRRLRNRLDELQLPIGQIENEWGQGYRFVPIRHNEQPSK
jgi:DNA-binding winged helix-turn-helix (wHTH) protein